MQGQVRSQILPPQTVKKHVKNRPRNLKTPEFTVLKRKLSSLSPSTVIDVSRIENQDSVYRHDIKRRLTEGFRCNSKIISEKPKKYSKNRLLNKFMKLKAEISQDKYMLHQQFCYQKTIGGGISGKVLHCKHRTTGKNVAVKMVKKSDRCGNTEIQILSYLTSLPQVVPLLAHFETANHKALVLPYMSKGDLYNFIASETMEQVRLGERTKLDRLSAKIIKHICQCIKRVHDAGFAHLDVKPENFLCTGNIRDDETNGIWICDFGFSKKCTDDEPISDGVARGSGGYMSPECVNGMECGPASDIWSIGSIAHVLLTGHVPFVYELDLAAMQFQRKDAPMVLQNDSNFDITIRAKEFLKATLNYDRNDRLTIDECLNHPWLWGI